VSYLNSSVILTSVTGLLSLAVLVLEIIALIDAAIRPSGAFPVADKQTKAMWLIILGVSTGWNLLVPGGFSSFINLLGAAAAIIYLVDVRPAVRSVGRGGSGRGPYG
jgi:hypothetical protein